MKKKQFIYLENIFKNNEKAMRLLFLLFEYGDYFFEFLNARGPYLFLENKKILKNTILLLKYFLFN